MLDLEIYETQSDLYFLLRGRVVLEECDRLKNTCIPLIHKGLEQVVVDLSKVEYIDSAGLGVLVGLKMTSSKNKARIVLLQPARSVSDILYISKLDGIFDIMTGVEADMLKAQLVQPANLFQQGSLSGGATSTPPPAEFPKATGSTFRAENASVDGASSANVPMGDGDSNNTEGLDLDPREKLEEYCRRAVEFMREGAFASSVEEYRKALALDPLYLPAMNNLAIVYEKQPSTIPMAIEQWEKVMDLSRQRGDQKHLDRAERHLASLKNMAG